MSKTAIEILFWIIIIFDILTFGLAFFFLMDGEMVLGLIFITLSIASIWEQGWNHHKYLTK